MITQKELKKDLHYDESTGVFTWITKKSGIKRKIAGYVDAQSGYAKITINGKEYRLHRLAWLYVTGKHPKDTIDHINHNKLDNRFSNLRDITQQENCKNQSKPKNNTSGVVGVNWHKQANMWQARISIKEKRISLGFFVKFLDAVNARKNAEVLYNYHENHGV